MILSIGASAFANSYPVGIQSISGNPPIFYGYGAFPSLPTISLDSLTYVTKTSSPYKTSGVSEQESGEMTEEVFQDSYGLVFAYQFDVTGVTGSGGTGTIDGLETDSYFGFNTYVDYASDVPSGFLGAPTSGDAVDGLVTSTGSAINFQGLYQPVGYGTYSPIMVIETNASYYGIGEMTVQDDGTDYVPAYVPSRSLGNIPNSVALPATCNTGLLLLACVGGFNAIRRKRALA